MHGHAVHKYGNRRVRRHQHVRKVEHAAGESAVTYSRTCKLNHLRLLGRRAMYQTIQYSTVLYCMILNCREKSNVATPRSLTSDGERQVSIILYTEVQQTPSITAGNVSEDYSSIILGGQSATW